MGTQCQFKKKLWTGHENRSKTYKSYLKIKVQGRILIMNVHNTAPYGDTPMCKIWLANVNLKKVMGLTRNHVKNQLNLTVRSKFKVVSGSWIYTTHYLLVKHLCAKNGKPMSMQNYGPKTCQEPYKFVKVKAQGRIWIIIIRDTSSHGYTPMCQIW